MKSKIVKLPDRRRIHVCDVCGSSKAWSESWSWYGSLLTEECGNVVKTCSDKCRAKIVDPELFFATRFGRKPGDKYYRK